MTPAESDFLLRLAALSLSFVGFSAVVVTLRGALGGELSARHLRLVRLYIEGGLLVTVLGLVPSLLTLLHLAESVVWRVASAAAALMFTFLLFVQFRRRRTVEGTFPPWVVIILAISWALVVALALNATGTFLPAWCRPLRASPHVGAWCFWFHFHSYDRNFPASRTSRLISVVRRNGCGHAPAHLSADMSSLAINSAARPYRSLAAQNQ